MRLAGSAGALVLGAAAAMPGPAEGQSAQVIACPSPALASQALQQSSSAVPDGCRTFVIRRDAAAGATAPRLGAEAKAAWMPWESTCSMATPCAECKA